MIGGFAEAGVYTPKIGEIDKMLRRKTALRDLDTKILSSEIIKGVIRRGDLDILKQYDQDLSFTLPIAVEAQRWTIVDWLMSKYLTRTTNFYLLLDIINYIIMLIPLWENDSFIKTYQKYKNNVASHMMDISTFEQNCCRSGNIHFY